MVATSEPVIRVAVAAADGTEYPYSGHTLEVACTLSIRTKTINDLG